jgi:hypothetical protein
MTYECYVQIHGHCLEEPAMLAAALWTNFDTSNGNESKFACVFAAVVQSVPVMSE